MTKQYNVSLVPASRAKGAQGSSSRETIHVNSNTFRRPENIDKVCSVRHRFANNLQILREMYSKDINEKLTQAEFAQLLGVTGDRPGERYGQYERGLREPPLWILAAIREITGYSLDSLIADSGSGQSLPQHSKGTENHPPKR